MYVHYNKHNADISLRNSISWLHLLWGVEAGYINKPAHDGEGFKEGILFQFSEGSFDGNTLTVKASKYRTPLGAVGSTFTARIVDGSWTVD